MTATASLTPYLNPPDAHRARAVIMSDDAGEVQVIAQERALVNLESLTKATTRRLRPLPHDVGAPTSAIPGHYNLPVIVDEALTQARELALATTEPGGYVRARGEDLVSGHADTRVAAFADPVGDEPTTASKEQDAQQIHSTGRGKQGPRKIRLAVIDKVAVQNLERFPITKLASNRQAIQVEEQSVYGLTLIPNGIDPSGLAIIIGAAVIQQAQRGVTFDHLLHRITSILCGDVVTRAWLFVGLEHQRLRDIAMAKAIGRRLSTRIRGRGPTQ